MSDLSFIRRFPRLSICLSVQYVSQYIIQSAQDRSLYRYSTCTVGPHIDIGDQEAQQAVIVDLHKNNNDNVVGGRWTRDTRRRRHWHRLGLDLTWWKQALSQQQAQSH